MRVAHVQTPFSVGVEAGDRFIVWERQATQSSNVLLGMIANFRSQSQLYCSAVDLGKDGCVFSPDAKRDVQDSLLI
jgi:hypothetical protein